MPISSWKTALALLGISAPVAFGQAPAVTQPLPLFHLFHAAGPLPSYDVATIKTGDPSSRIGPARGMTLRAYILSAYGVSTLSQGQLIGGPAWVGTDFYVIQGKVSDDLRDAMQKMTPEDRRSETLMLEESLLVDRFAFKAHFETRDLPVYELSAAKSGFKFKEVPAPPVYGPGNPPPPRVPGAPTLAGSVVMGTTEGVTRLRGSAIPMRVLISLLRNDAEINGRPIVDKTGFTGYLDSVDMRWAGLDSAQSTGGDATNADVPSLFTAVEESLGLKLTETKAPTEVLVIDHIERPSEN